MNLYALVNYLTEIEGKLDAWAQEHEGDITDFPLSAELDAAKDAIDEKALKVAAWIKNQKSEAGAIAEEIKTLTARKRATENRAERLTAYLAANIQEGTKLKAAWAEIGWRKSEQVLVSCDPSALPDTYKRVTVEPDKTALKTAIKGGAEIAGVSIITKQNIQIK